MAEYRPSAPFNVALTVRKPTYTKAVGVNKANYSAENEFQIFGTFKTYGGTESNVNGVYSIIDTAEIETWYRPDITSDCQIILIETGAKYRIMGDVENINRRNMFMKFKVEREKGGA